MHLRLINNAIPLKIQERVFIVIPIVSLTYQWTWKHLPFMLRSTELNTFSMTNTIYRDLVGINQ